MEGFSASMAVGTAHAASHRRVPIVPAILAVLAALLLTAPAGGSTAGGGGRVRGVVISTHTDGRDWASDRMEPTMREIRALGAGWVAIHPYAGIRADGTVRFRPFDPDSPPEHIARPIRMAHRLGLKILIKPHLAYWGSPFRWRGEIRFGSAVQWERFWRGYEAWIVQLARASRGADAFSVGTELDRTVDQEHRWRRIIRAVRRETPAPLTYSANWTDFEKVPFWDAVDAIGIHAYFPLTDRPGAGEDAIREGWIRWMDVLRTTSRRHDRPIVFTELGYNRSFEAPARPWEYGTDGAAARAVQEACMRIALRAIEEEPAVVGAFLWKWFPEPHPVGRNFQLATPGMKRVIREAWAN